MFFWPKKSFFSLKLVNFWTLFSKFFQIFDPQNPFFVPKLSPSLFFCLEKSFFFFKIGQFLDLIIKFSPIFGPKKPFSFLSSVSACFLLVFLFFSFEIWSIFGLKNPFFFFLSSAPACFFGPKSLFFSFFF